jgi:superfamily II DNA/RNA helicase
VDDVKFVINYDFPQCTEDYVHRFENTMCQTPKSRIGRTGRKGNTGTAYTFFTHKNSRNAGDLVKILKEANQVRQGWKRILFCILSTYFRIKYKYWISCRR